MKKINLKGISEILSKKEMKNVFGGYTCNCTLANGFRGCHWETNPQQSCTSCACT